jgi:hypothetical protein
LSADANDDLSLPIPLLLSRSYVRGSPAEARYELVVLLSATGWLKLSTAAVLREVVTASHNCHLFRVYRKCRFSFFMYWYCLLSITVTFSCTGDTKTRNMLLINTAQEELKLTNSCSKVILKQLALARVAKKFSTFYITRKFITHLTKARQWTPF